MVQATKWLPAILDYMWPSTEKPGTTRHPSKIFFMHLQSCRHPDIELSKFYHRSLSRSHYNRPNCSLPLAWNNIFLRNQSIFSRYLRTPRCTRLSCRRSHMKKVKLNISTCLASFRTRTANYLSLAYGRGHQRYKIICVHALVGLCLARPSYPCSTLIIFYYFLIFFFCLDPWLLHAPSREGGRDVDMFNFTFFI